MARERGRTRIRPALVFAPPSPWPPRPRLAEIYALTPSLTSSAPPEGAEQRAQPRLSRRPFREERGHVLTWGPLAHAQERNSATPLRTAEGRA